MTAVPLVELGYAATGNSWWSSVEEEPTPELRWPRSVEVFDAMRRQDAQVASVLRAVTLPVRRTDWRLDAAGVRDEVAQLVAEDLGLPLVGAQPPPASRTRDRFSWGEHLRLSLLQPVFGHMFFEQVYRPDESGRRYRLRKLAPRMPRTIAEIRVARDGGLEGIVQHPPAGAVRTSGQAYTRVSIPADRLVAYVYDREGGSWLGQSLLRPAYKHWLIKDRLLRVWAQTIERNGMGVPLYKGEEGETDLSKGLAMAQKWRAGEASGAAVGNTADLVLRGVEGDLPDANPAVRYQDEQIARAVLAHFLNLGSQGGGQVGSYALGATFADFFISSLQALAQHIADVASQHVVEDLVDINFGPDEPAPKVVFDEIGSRQPATAQAIKALLDAGAIFPDRSMEEALRQQYGLPPKDTPPPAPPPEEPA